jgi:hypothetical protein
VNDDDYFLEPRRRDDPGTHAPRHGDLLHEVKQIIIAKNIKEYAAIRQIPSLSRDKAQPIK